MTFVCVDDNRARSTDEVLAAVLADTPDVLASLVAASAEAWATVDPCLLELCRLEVAAILCCRAELDAPRSAGFDEAKAAALGSWSTSPLFDERDRACLAFTDQFVLDVASLDDVAAQRVSDRLGAQGLVDFTNALLVIEQRQRLRLIWERLFDEST